MDATYTYDNEGKQQTVQYPNIGGPGGVALTTYTHEFDELGRPKKLTRGIRGSRFRMCWPIRCGTTARWDR